jgi:dTDP-glucose pyrophosphorylase
VKNIIEHSKETAKMERELTNLIVGAVLSGQKRVMVQGIEVTWKPLKTNLTTKERETEAKKIAKMNLDVILG